MEIDKSIHSKKFVSAYPAAQLLSASQMELIRQACSALSFCGKDLLLGKELDAISQYQAQYLRSISYSLTPFISRMGQSILQPLDTAAFSPLFANIVRKFVSKIFGKYLI